MKISMIAAMDRKQTIGDGIGMPWYHPADLARFKELTYGKPIIMGRKTHEAIGRILAGRMNVVLSSKAAYQPIDGAVKISSIDEIPRICHQAEEIMIIGGGQLYETMIKSADELQLTVIDHEYPGGVSFPTIDLVKWECVNRESINNDPKFLYPYRYEVWRKIV